jgi:hypothetical protein
MDKKKSEVKRRAKVEDNLKHEYCVQMPSDEKMLMRTKHFEMWEESIFYTPSHFEAQSVPKKKKKAGKSLNLIKWVKYQKGIYVAVLGL